MAPWLAKPVKPGASKDSATNQFPVPWLFRAAAYVVAAPASDKACFPFHVAAGASLSAAACKQLIIHSRWSGLATCRDIDDGVLVNLLDIYGVAQCRVDHVQVVQRAASIIGNRAPLFAERELPGGRPRASGSVSHLERALLGADQRRHTVMDVTQSCVGWERAREPRRLALHDNDASAGRLRRAWRVARPQMRGAELALDIMRVRAAPT